MGKASDNDSSNPLLQRGNSRHVRGCTLSTCVIGMGTFLAWTVGNSYTNQLAGLDVDPTAHMLDIAVGIGFNVAILLAATLLAQRVESLVEHRHMRIAAGLLGTGGPILVAVLGDIGASPLFAVGSALKGAASALLFLMWNELFCRLNMKNASICYAGAYLTSVILQVGIAALPCRAAFVATLVCAVISAATLRPAGTVLQQAGAEHDTLDCAFPWKLVIMVTAFTFVAFVSHQLLGEGLASFGWIGGGAVAAVCLAGSLLFFERRFDASVFENVAMPLIVAGLLLFCWQGWTARGEALLLIDAGNVAFRIFLLVVLCNICYRYNIRALWLFPIARIPMMLAEGCGLALSLGLPLAGVDLLDSANTPLLYGMIMLLVMIAAPIGRNSRLSDASSDPACTGQGLVHLAESSRGQSIEAVLWSVNKLARLYGLTHREEEVLSCLVEGMSRVQIQERLVLSESTVRTHMRHLYAKLGVHSKEEAVGMVTSAEPRERLQAR